MTTSPFRRLASRVVARRTHGQSRRRRYRDLRTRPVNRVPDTYGPGPTTEPGPGRRTLRHLAGAWLLVRVEHQAGHRGAVDEHAHRPAGGVGQLQFDSHPLGQRVTELADGFLGVGVLDGPLRLSDDDFLGHSGNLSGRGGGQSTASMEYAKEKSC